MIGEQVDILPFNIPFPVFSDGAKIGSNDIPYMWHKPFVSQLNSYINMLKRAADEGKGVNNASMNYESIRKYWNEKQSRIVPWDKKIPKAAFSGACSVIRQIVFDIALLRPDLLDVDYTITSNIDPWNPESLEPDYGNKLENFGPEKNNSAKTGFLQPLLALKHKNNDQYFLDSGLYKYLIVMTGHGGYSTADRIIPFLREFF
jgi:hypothetical protein